MSLEALAFWVLAVVDILRRRDLRTSSKVLWALAVLVVPVIVTGTAAGLSPLGHRAYQSRVEVLVSPVSLAPLGSQPAPPVNMTTEARMESLVLVQQARESIPARVHSQIAALHDNQAT